MQLIFCYAGIAASNRSHVKQFACVADYVAYYDIAVEVGEIGVEHFATREQTMLVAYLRARYGNHGLADWCERYWTGDCGRYCLVHSRYAGCSNNLGVDVYWR